MPISEVNETSRSQHGHKVNHCHNLRRILDPTAALFACSQSRCSVVHPTPSAAPVTPSFKAGAQPFVPPSHHGLDGCDGGTMLQAQANKLKPPTRIQPRQFFLQYACKKGLHCPFWHDSGALGSSVGSPQKKRLISQHLSMTWMTGFVFVLAQGYLWLALILVMSIQKNQVPQLPFQDWQRLQPSAMSTHVSLHMGCFSNSLQTRQKWTKIDGMHLQRFLAHW